MARQIPRADVTRLDVAALSFVGFLAVFFGCSALGFVNEADKTKECIERVRKLGQGIFQYCESNGRYPGYLNALQRDDGKSYVDPDTNQPTPVSWAVMILPEIDQKPLYDQWLKSGPNQPDPRNTVIEQLLCPREFDERPEQPLISYVVNTGMPDAPPGLTMNAGNPDSPAIPRDWPPNGMFFDHFTDHFLTRTATTRPTPIVYMSDEKVIDSKDQTILLTENVDAVEYVFRGKHAADHWRAAEVQTGCTWQMGSIDLSTTPPTMQPPSPSLAINVDIGKGDGQKYEYCRPSSRHPGGVVCGFVGGSVTLLRDKIPYFVYAKLMASDDENVKLPGQTALVHMAFREYQLSQTMPRPN